MKMCTCSQKKASSVARRVPVADDIVGDNNSDMSRVSESSALIISKLQEEHRKKVEELECKLAPNRELVERYIDHRMIGTSPHVRDYLDDCVDVAKSSSTHGECNDQPVVE